MKKLAGLIFFLSTVASAQVNISPNMSMPVPIPSITPGPAWATDINASLNIIDSHNHSPGQGVQIQPNGLNITSDLSFQSNNATSLRTTRFAPQASPIPNAGADKSELYVFGNELYFNDATGSHQVQMTLNGFLNAVSSGISNPPASASFVSGTLVVLSNVNVPANVKMGSVQLGNAASFPNFLTLQTPASIPNYTLTLPVIPGAQSFVTLDTSGNFLDTIPISQGITSANIANTTIVAGNIAANTITNGQIALNSQINATNTTITTTYSVLTSDVLILASSSGGAYTITLYNPATQPGFKVEIHKSTNDTNIITIGTAAGTINGSATTTIATQFESLVLQSDGGNWRIISRDYPRGWIGPVATTITGTTTNPTKGAGGSFVDHIWYRRDGGNMWIRVGYKQQTAGATGSGAYQLTPPGGWTIDTTQVDADTQITTGGQTANMMGYFFINSGTDFMNARPVVFNSTKITFQGVNSAGSQPFWGSGQSTFGSTNLNFGGVFMVPILGWN